MTTAAVALSRRSLLRAGVALGGAVLLGRPASASTAAAQEILPRSVWTDAMPSSPLPVEASGDVRVLLVHHTASGNSYAPDDVVNLLRGFHSFHTGSEKGWPDLAYNFMIDRFGRIWEGRAGSIDGPVIGDATGGNQGFTQLCCFIGDHSSELPTAEAQSAMVSLLAWLADRYGVDTAPGATASFVSRGSNRHAQGSTVTSPTITGHRTMSQTACPGDEAMRMVEEQFPIRVSAARQRPQAVPVPEPTSTPEPIEQVTPLSEPEAVPVSPVQTPAPTATDIARANQTPLPTPPPTPAPTPSRTPAPAFVVKELTTMASVGLVSSTMPRVPLGGGMVGAGVGLAALTAAAVATRRRRVEPATYVRPSASATRATTRPELPPPSSSTKEPSR